MGLEGLSTHTICFDLVILSGLESGTSEPSHVAATVKMQLEGCFDDTLKHKLVIFTGFSPSQGRETKEEVRTGGENFLAAPRLVDNNQKPPWV